MASAQNPFILYNDLADPKFGAVLVNTVPAGDASFPSINALHRDRYTVWKSTGASSYNLDIDLGSTKAISGVGVANYKPVTAGQTLPSVSVFASSDGTTWGSPQGSVAGSFFNSNVAEWSQRFPADINARYWRFAFSGSTNLFTLGKAYVGTFFSFINVPGGPEAGSSIVESQYRVRSRTLSGLPIIDTLGLPRRIVRWQLVADDSVFVPIRDVVRSGRPFIATDWLGDTIHAELTSEDRVTFDAIWGLPNLWRIVFEMEQLP